MHTVTNPIPNRPEFLRLPKSGQRDPLTGLSRSALNALILPTKENSRRPPVKSVVLKSRKSADRGTRLIDVASLLEYLNSLAAAAPSKSEI